MSISLLAFLNSSMNIAILYLTISSIGYFGYIYSGNISYLLYFIHILITPLLSIFLLEIPNVANLMYIIIMFGLVLLFIIYMLHIKSSKNFAIEYSLSQILPVMLVSLLFLLAVTLPNSNIMTLQLRRNVYVFFIAVFVLFSIPNLNKKRRMFLICKEFDIDSIDAFKIEYSEKISKCARINQDDRDLIFFYLVNGIDMYIEGSFENAFLSFYKILFDRKFDSYYMINGYEIKREKYALIRHSLAHAKIEEYIIEDVEYNIDSVEKISAIRKELPNTTKDLLVLMVREFLDEIIERE